MPSVNVSEAAKLAGISRQSLYKNYINTGKISVTPDHKGKPMIDTSEILRVFGELQADVSQVSKNDTSLQSKPSVDTRIFESEIERLKAEVEGLRALAEERKARVEEQKQWIESLERKNSLLLEDKSKAGAMPWWKRLLNR